MTAEMRNERNIDVSGSRIKIWKETEDVHDKHIIRSATPHATSNCSLPALNENSELKAQQVQYGGTKSCNTSNGIWLIGGSLNPVVDLIGGSTVAYREEPVFLVNLVGARRLDASKVAIYEHPMLIGGSLNPVVDLIGGSTVAYREEPVFLVNLVGARRLDASKVAIYEHPIRPPPHAAAPTCARVGVHAARWPRMLRGRWLLLCASCCANDGRPLLAVHAHWLRNIGASARCCAPLMARDDHRGRAYGCAMVDRYTRLDLRGCYATCWPFGGHGWLILFGTMIS
ncbi:TMV resistance protein N-like [Dorcoceras hygrometricum]|uniref:TMV resistance protein N-like n=1 Tax=Dorcoceras hygrometricum TaxID=472368 RepID=A0A2Z7CPK8_9LAMI|nr:TMV resistance protein N-like [Dorcoceras hygrometricum]